MKRFVHITIAAGVLASLTAPAQAQNREHQQMAAELRILQEKQQEQALQLDKLSTALADAIKTLTAINARLDSSDAATRKALADDKTILDNVNTTLRTISERTSDTNSRIGTLREDITALTNAVATLNAAPPASSTTIAPDGTTTSAEPAGGAANPTPARPLPSGLTPSRLYDLAWNDYTQGSMIAAITGFETFLREYPKAERAVDAQWYIAESNMRLKKLPEAIAGYAAVTQNYPNGGDRIPDAYYQLGEAQRARGNLEAARTAWETVVKKYPDSNGAILAKQRLDGLPPPAAARP
jgi:tol-pal system protein YbgF